MLLFTHPVLGLQSVITRLQTATSDRELIALLINWEQQQTHDQDLMESVEGFNPEDPQDVFDHLMAKVHRVVHVNNTPQNTLIMNISWSISSNAICQWYTAYCMLSCNLHPLLCTGQLHLRSCKAHKHNDPPPSRPQSNAWH